MKKNQILALTESAVMIALATVLSIIKIIDMPYGGSVTPAAMLPIAIIAYRHGAKYGIGAALTASLLQLLLGLENFSYVTGWVSYIALSVFDYVIAYAGFGLAGVFKRKIESQSLSLAAGITLSNVIRYLCHVIAGATVWAGLPIPDGAALIYSVSYNATYMIPETIISALVAIYIGSVVDFRVKTPTRMHREKLHKTAFYCYTAAGITALAGLICDTALVFSKLQDAESGEFSFAGLASVNWLAFGIVTASCALVFSAILIAVKLINDKKSAT